MGNHPSNQRPRERDRPGWFRRLLGLFDRTSTLAIEDRPTDRTVSDAIPTSVSPIPTPINGGHATPISGTSTPEPVESTTIQDPNTHAARAFRKCFADLAQGITEPLTITSALYSSECIAKDTKDCIFLPKYAANERNLILLNALEREIFTNPSAFWKLVDTFDKEASMSALASQLRTAYSEQSEGDPDNTVPCSPAIACYADYLRAYYRTATILPDTFALNHTKRYVNITIVDENKKKQPLSFENVLNSKEYPDNLKCVLVEGPPGVGKSTIALNLCQKWDELKATRQYSLVVLLKLREKRIQNATSVSELFYYPYDDSLQQAVTEDVLTRQGAQTLLVLDGFDEASTTLTQESIIFQILNGKQLRKATLLVTSRPSESDKLLKTRGFKLSKHIKVVGFSRDQIREYVSARFANDPNLRDDFLEHVSCNPAIQSILHLPVNCGIVTEVFEANIKSGRVIPQTVTQVYTEFSLTLLRGYMLKEGDCFLDLLAESLDSLPPQYYAQLHQLAKLAYQGIMQGEIIFYSLPDGCNTLDLMTASSELHLGENGEASYNFIHLTLQEYLAALHISCLSPSQQIREFEACSAVTHTERVWKFVAGLTGFRSIGWELVEARRGRDEHGRVLPFLVECLYESQDQRFCEQVLGQKENIFWGWGNCTMFDCYAVGYCVSASKCYWELVLRNNAFDSDALGELVKGIKSREVICGAITSLDLHSNCIQKCGIAFLSELPQQVTNKIAELDLTQTDLDSAAFNLLSDKIHTMSSLRKLSIARNNPGSGGVVKLLAALAKLPAFEDLTMPFLDIGHDDIQALSHLIQSSSKRLHRIAIGDVSMSPECVDLMMEAVLCPSSLKIVEVFNTNLTGCYASLLQLEQNCNLKQLKFHWCPTGSQTVSSLARALRTNRSMETLHVDSLFVDRAKNQIGTEGAFALAETLKTNTALKELKLLDDESITEYGAQALINALQHNSTLKLLQLPQTYSTAPTDERVYFL